MVSQCKIMLLASFTVRCLEFMCVRPKVANAFYIRCQKIFLCEDLDQLLYFRVLGYMLLAGMLPMISEVDGSFIYVFSSK